MNFRIATIVVLATTCSALLAQPPASPTAPAAPSAQPVAVKPANYRGRLTLRTGQELAFFVKVASANSATMSIPLQSVEDAPLSDVVITADKMAFTLAVQGMPAGAEARFDLAMKPDGSGAGLVRQAGMESKAWVTRMAPDEEFGPRRPQNPVSPFPYDQREVKLENPNDHAALAGTLTIPQGKAGQRHPAVVLITGSGPQDRDETLLTHKPFLVIADHLSRHGLAVLRLDDRGVGGSSSPTPDPTSLTFAEDIAAAVAFLKTQPEIDPARIGLVGHSEGGLIAPIVAAGTEDVRFIVLLAGTGVNGREILREQVAAIMRAGGAAQDKIDSIVSLQGKVFDALLGGAPAADLDAAIRKMSDAQYALANKEPPNEEQQAALTEMVEQQSKALGSKWFRTFLTLDPREHLRRVRCPVLALNGALDVQVVARQNVPEIARALLEGGNGDVTTAVLPSLNHLFQTCKTGSPDEYMLIDETFAPAALDAMTRWLRVRAGLDPWPALEKPSALPMPDAPVPAGH